MVANRVLGVQALLASPTGYPSIAESRAAINIEASDEAGRSLSLSRSSISESSRSSTLVEFMRVELPEKKFTPRPTCRPAMLVAQIKVGWCLHFNEVIRSHRTVK